MAKDKGQRTLDSFFGSGKGKKRSPKPKKRGAEETASGEATNSSSVPSKKSKTSAAVQGKANESASASNDRSAAPTGRPAEGRERAAPADGRLQKGLVQGDGANDDRCNGRSGGACAKLAAKEGVHDALGDVEGGAAGEEEENEGKDALLGVADPEQVAVHKSTAYDTQDSDEEEEDDASMDLLPHLSQGNTGDVGEEEEKDPSCGGMNDVALSLGYGHDGAAGKPGVVQVTPTNKETSTNLGAWLGRLPSHPFANKSKKSSSAPKAGVAGLSSGESGKECAINIGFQATVTPLKAAAEQLNSGVVEATSMSIVGRGNEEDDAEVEEFIVAQHDGVVGDDHQGKVNANSRITHAGEKGAKKAAPKDISSDAGTSGQEDTGKRPDEVIGADPTKSMVQRLPRVRGSRHARAGTDLSHLANDDADFKVGFTIVRPDGTVEPYPNNEFVGDFVEMRFLESDGSRRLFRMPVVANAPEIRNNTPFLEKLKQASEFCIAKSNDSSADKREKETSSPTLPEVADERMETAGAYTGASSFELVHNATYLATASDENESTATAESGMSRATESALEMEGSTTTTASGTSRATAPRSSNTGTYRYCGSYLDSIAGGGVTHSRTFLSSAKVVAVEEIDALAKEEEKGCRCFSIERSGVGAIHIHIRFKEHERKKRKERKVWGIRIVFYIPPSSESVLDPVLDEVAKKFREEHRECNDRGQVRDQIADSYLPTALRGLGWQEYSPVGLKKKTEVGFIRSCGNDEEVSDPKLPRHFERRAYSMFLFQTNECFSIERSGVGAIHIHIKFKEHEPKKNKSRKVWGKKIDFYIPPSSESVLFPLLGEVAKKFREEHRECNDRGQVRDQIADSYLPTALRGLGWQEYSPVGLKKKAAVGFDLSKSRDSFFQRTNGTWTTQFSHLDFVVRLRNGERIDSPHLGGVIVWNDGSIVLHPTPGESPSSNAPSESVVLSHLPYQKGRDNDNTHSSCPCPFDCGKNVWAHPSERIHAMSNECAVKLLDLKVENNGIRTYFDYLEGKRKLLTFCTGHLPVKFLLARHVHAFKEACEIEEELTGFRAHSTDMARLRMADEERAERRNAYNRQWHRKRVEAKLLETAKRFEEMEKKGDFDYVTEEGARDKAVTDAMRVGQDILQSEEMVGVYAFDCTLDADGTIKKNEHIAFCIDKSRSPLLLKNENGIGVHLSFDDFGEEGSDALLEIEVVNMRKTKGGSASKLFENDYISGLEQVLPRGLLINQGYYGGDTDPEGNSICGAAIIKLLNLGKRLKEKKVGYSLNAAESVKTEIAASVPEEMQHWLPLSGEIVARHKAESEKRKARHDARDEKAMSELE